MSNSKPQKFIKTCVVCGQRFVGGSNRTTCGSEVCMESNRHGVRPFADELYEEELVDELTKVSDNELIDELNRRGYAADIRPMEEKFYMNVNISDLYTDMFKFGVVSDTHIGSVYQQMTYLHLAYDIFEKEDITFVVHGGDLVEGDGRQYRGQAGEMFLGGIDKKVKYTKDNYPKKPNMETVIVGGSHDYIFLKNSGFDVLDNVCSDREDLCNYGYFRADLTINDYEIAVVHGIGGWTYARSYRLEKWIDKQNKLTIPDMTLMGHFHHASYLPDCRGTEGFMLPCFQGLTPYLEERSLYPTIGFMIISIKRLSDTGIWAITPQFVVFKEELKEDF